MLTFVVSISLGDIVGTVLDEGINVGDLVHRTLGVYVGVPVGVPVGVSVVIGISVVSVGPSHEFDFEPFPALDLPDLAG